MPKYQIGTESGSLYQLDTDKKTLHRHPGEGSGELDYDGEEFTYEWLMDELTIGNSLRAVWDDKGRKRVRTSTSMNYIEKL